MNSLKILFLSCSFHLVLNSCNYKPSVEEKLEPVHNAVSGSYEPPLFTSDERAEKIREIEPRLHELLQTYARENHIPGIAYGVVVGDELVIGSALGFMKLEEQAPATTASAFRIASMTKSFVTMAIMKLRDEGHLSLSDPVARYIPEFAELKYPTADSPAIDIENLMTMSSGFPEDNAWADRQLNESEEMLTDLIAEGISFSTPPSHQYEYSNTGYALLGRIISEVVGQPYQEYIREHILLPLGMNNTYWEYENIPEDRLAHGYRREEEQWKPEPILHDGSFGAIGGLITTIEDFSKYVSFHLSAWPARSGNDSGTVKRSSLREMHQPQFSRLYPNATGPDGDPCPVMVGYGYGLSIATDCNGVRQISHSGALPGFGSEFIFFPDYGIGMMAFGNRTYTIPWPSEEVKELIFDTGLKPRELPASDILVERQEQLVELLRSWDASLEEEVLAKNFFLDNPRELYLTEIREMMEKAGAIQSIGQMQPRNRLRGSFRIQTENGQINVFFSLSPEKDPKVQRLSASFREDGS